jgi:cytochrome c oxidase subunit I
MATLLRRYLFSTDHKTIGVQYGLTSLFFLLIAFALVLIIRWQHAYSGQPLPLIGGLLGEVAPGGVVPPELYNQLGAMHGTITVFLGVVPLAVGALAIRAIHSFGLAQDARQARCHTWHRAAGVVHAR